jgi:hypothetical protein
METQLSVNQKLFARNVGKLIDFIYSSDYSCTLGEAFRTPEQAKIYAAEGKGIVDSQHCKRLAIDINLFLPMGVYLENTKDYEPIGKYWESLHPLNRWGGRFPKADGNHMEMKDK